MLDYDVSLRYCQEMLKHEFAKRLIKARINGGFKSAERFAKCIGLNPHCYRTYERGESYPPFMTLLRICETLDTTPDNLLLDPLDRTDSVV